MQTIPSCRWYIRKWWWYHNQHHRTLLSLVRCHFSDWMKGLLKLNVSRQLRQIVLNSPKIPVLNKSLRWTNQNNGLCCYLMRLKERGQPGRCFWLVWSWFSQQPFRASYLVKPRVTSKKILTWHHITVVRYIYLKIVKTEEVRITRLNNEVKRLCN